VTPFSARSATLSPALLPFCNGVVGTLLFKEQQRGHHHHVAGELAMVAGDVEIGTAAVSLG
jgi:hypothetical protein